MTVRYVMPVVVDRDDTWRNLRYVSICGWRWAFRSGGCE